MIVFGWAYEMTFDYKGWLKAAQDRLELLYRQKSAIEDEIEKLERGIEGFAPLAELPPAWAGPNAGITQTIRDILKANPARAFLPTEVRDELLNRGVRLEQDNPMATVHQILARIAKEGTAKPLAQGNRTRYQWNPLSPLMTTAVRYRRGAATMPPPEPLTLTSPEDEHKRKK